MEPTASDYFAAIIDSYDSLIRRAVPRYDEMLERLVDYLPPAASRVLELGCGTGNLSVSIARRYPHAAFTFLDASPEMLEATRERVGSRAARYLARRFEDVGDDLGSFDLVVSSISLHHVSEKASMYRAIYRLLVPGGTFRFSDQIRGGSDSIHDLNWERWIEFCRMPGNCTQDEIQSLLDHAEAHDHYTPLHEHFRLLADSGFGNLDCVWRNWIWGIVVADRS